MTARAVGRNSSVIVTGGHENPVAPHLVATITRCGSHQVGRRLSTGLDPVMTGRAGTWHNSKMPEGQAGPGNGPMAIVAGHSRRNVRCGLSLHRAVVMTLRTTSWSYAIMRKKRGCPICRPVAAVTVNRGGQMVRGLKGGYDSSARRMALHT